MSNLDKIFISRKWALDLKNMGFDEPCFRTYSGEEGKPMNMTGRFEGSRNSNLKNGRISAPTFEQALAWIREKFQLHGSINMSLYLPEKTISWDIKIVSYANKEIFVYYESKNWTSHQLAQENMLCQMMYRISKLKLDEQKQELQYK